MPTEDIYVHVMSHDTWSRHERAHPRTRTHRMRTHHGGKHAASCSHVSRSTVARAGAPCVMSTHIMNPPGTDAAPANTPRALGTTARDASARTPSDRLPESQSQQHKLVQIGNSVFVERPCSQRCICSRRDVRRTVTPRTNARARSLASPIGPCAHRTPCITVC